VAGIVDGIRDLIEEHAMSTQPSTRPRPERVLPIAPGRWSVVPAASDVAFSVRELGLVSVHGSFPVVDGTVEVDGSGRPVSVRATLDARGIATGNARRDRDLRGPKFLAADRWPALSFTSREVHGAGPEEWTVVGTLQVRDVRSPLTLTVRLAGIRPGGAGSDGAGSDGARSDGARSDGARSDGARPDHARRAVATGTVDRREAGVRTAPTFVIGSAVRISLDVTLTPPGH
jgi:polyisoprenoid-binding protein YceI